MSETLIPVGSVVEPDPLPTGVSAGDTAYLQQASLMNLTEIAAAGIALERSSDPATRQFAQWMIADHSVAQGEVAYLASKLGVTLPTTLTAQQQAELSQLQSVPAASFNATYSVGQVADHIMAIQTTQQEVAGDQNTAVVDTAQQLLPVLEQHFNASEALAFDSTGLQLGPATVQSAPSLPPGAPVGTPNAQDVAFVQAAAQANLLEVASGGLAQQQSGNPAVAQFGAWMTTDHTASQNVLQTIGTQEGVSVPTSLDAANQQQLANLQSLTGSSFSETYVPMEVIGHADTIMTFLHEVETGQDPAFTSYANQQLVTLAQHLQGALLLQQTLPTPSASEMASIDTSLSSLVSAVGAFGNTGLTQLVTNIASIQPGFAQFQSTVGHLDIAGPVPTTHG